MPLLPFAVVLVEVEVIAPGTATAINAHGAPPDLPQTWCLGKLLRLSAEDAVADDIAVALEATRFAITSDTPEMQALAAVGPSRYPEVEACRAFFRDKQRRESAGLCSNAWD